MKFLLKVFGKSSSKTFPVGAVRKAFLTEQFC